MKLLSGSDHITIHRRDLFDARLQLISQDSGSKSDSDALEFIDTPSDLVPGVYEGGMKSWECSFDLVHYLARSDNVVRDSAAGGRILEVCGDFRLLCWNEQWRD